MWERGGGYTNTGYATIIAGGKGEMKRATYIRRHGHLACGEHALIIVQVGDLVIYAAKADDVVSVYRIVGIEFDQITLDRTHYYFQGEWDVPPPEILEPAIEAASRKCRSYHCRSVYYAIEH